MTGPGSSDSPGATRRVAIVLFAALVVYGNLAVTFQPRKLGFDKSTPSLWMPDAIQDAFLLPGMFSGFFSIAFDYVLEGERADGVWVALPIKEHFPLRHGVTFTQLYASRHQEVFGERGQHEVWKRYGRQIRDRHNRLHPSRPVRRIRLGAEYWPLSPAGYRANKQPGKVKRILWYTQPEPP